ncbi:putative F420-dependent oxidoreductase domain protein [Mycolicibacterium hassiacum DSM 44199]|uniref:Putative F420-dependent oxidoreductase domain protein n=1 Tax=Mycolicibacterium hassiacum (strain DSM 44199 / CIP 105218 / JCM 12690 / 3849) TaxID=1122247 RepID=K5B7A5_MYCHD|nr:TIGR03619 family F420-dependent LLM class oxidoreductase [Mycolicibacterium hassiacum]EKF21608.1 putative F420-dependent oxidoreductase domain protein [Mycolicibacterium hassiacum DSM 44199]MBX5485448.1 TIGR03619 family F420-dependent LLM class oxidoreductase [Mycolicibacterium hassiacum]MDA4084300.1 F420-dependent oxidoreductase [Mycolicibacterium hassiacum DSM 44199]VCT91309.1 F420-dependent glucose-6-phosphate dehydrogenase 1 [Mycolicibacterium hassiacum DSM 44199]
MKFTVEYPSEAPRAHPGFRHPAVMRALAVRIEELGFDAIAVSEHPAPSKKWREAGGHDTFDPVVALSFFAAATTSVRLMTNLMVLPFRNPYLAAKALTSLDIVSGGRLIAGVGAGYLPSEFATLGVHYEDRVRVFDDSVAALHRIWTDPDPRLHLDAPVQKPHPPLWFGGNSAATLRRVVRYGSGWCPIIAPESVTASVRTAAIADLDTFARRVEKLCDLLTAADRDPAEVEIQTEAPQVDLGDAAAVTRLTDQVAAMERAGATRIIVHVDAATPEAAETYLTRFADHFGVGG